MKKKVGILTTYFATNFGAMLQPFALKRYIEQMGYEVEMIRYEQKPIWTYYNPWKPQILKSRDFRAIRKYMSDLPGLLKRHKAFNKFLHKFVTSESGFCSEIPKDKDFYFIGSDQIWNPLHTDGFDDVYFGKFDAWEGAVKASYAASAENIDYTSAQVEYLRENLNNFDRISVRESVLEENLKKYTGRKDICTVLDPTMLVDNELYKEICCQHPCPGQKFIFFYGLRNCVDFRSKCLEYTKRINARMVIMSEMPDIDYTNFAKQNKEVLYLPYAGIELFLGSVKYAEMVFTSSFHGSIFAILNHKQFFTLNLRDSKMTRPLHLLKMLELNEHLLSVEDEIRLVDTDWDRVEHLLNVQRTLSRNFISEVLNIKK